MRIRRPASPLLLLLLPFLTSNVVFVSALDTELKIAHELEEKAPLPRDTKPLTPDFTSLAPLKPTAGLGTKDAPVDGKDGKPHAGPFVDLDGDRTKAKSTEDDVSELIIDKKPPSLKNAPTDLAVVDGKKIPEKNDGIMNDPSRASPKVGSTGTEGGVSEKDKARKAQEGQTGEKVEMTPTPPKEAPPLPQSDQDIKPEAAKAEKDAKKTKIKDGDSDDDDVAQSLSGLEKPEGLPEKPHDVPQPIPNSANKDHLEVAKPAKSTIGNSGEEEETLIQPFHSFVLALTMILFSEIGDKTFLIAALMAMKYDRMLVFSAALSALLAMTVLSALFGHAVPTLLPKRFTNFAAAVLFLIFGVKMLKEGLAMSPSEGVAAEMQEVEMELEEKELQARQNRRRKSSISPYALEMGMGRTRKSRSNSRLPSPPRSPSSSPERDELQGASVQKLLAGFGNLFSLLLSPAWVQTFVMTFLGEWGDRSQIATIAMAAGQDYWWVTGGAISGHAVCTGVAVLGGRAIAGKVSLRVVTLGGAIAFLVFGVIYTIEAAYYA